MGNDEHIVSYTMAEIKTLNARGSGKSDWAKVRSMTEAELEASIDWEEEGGEPNPFTGRAGAPFHTQTVTIPVDRDIAAWFQNRAPTYRQQIIAVLVNYVYREERRRAEQAEHPPHQRRAS